MECNCYATREHGMQPVLSKLARERYRLWRLAATCRDHSIARFYLNVFLSLYRWRISHLKNSENIRYSHFRCHNICHFSLMPCASYHSSKPVQSMENVAIVVCIFD